MGEESLQLYRCVNIQLLTHYKKLIYYSVTDTIFSPARVSMRRVLSFWGDGLVVKEVQLFFEFFIYYDNCLDNVFSQFNPTATGLFRE